MKVHLKNVYFAITNALTCHSPVAIVFQAQRLKRDH